MFICTRLDYGDVIYDQTTKASFSGKIKSVQYKAALAITGTIEGKSRVRLYHKLGLEKPSSKKWMRHLCHY